MLAKYFLQFLGLIFPFNSIVFTFWVFFNKLGRESFLLSNTFFPFLGFILFCEMISFPSLYKQQYILVLDFAAAGVLSVKVNEQINVIIANENVTIICLIKFLFMFFLRDFT